MTRLVIGDIPHDFDPARDLALGPWCFSGREQACPDWDRLAFVDGFPTTAERQAARRAASALVNFEAARLAPEMNRRHGTAFGVPYWRLVLGAWLFGLVDGSLGRWRHVERFAAAHPGPVTVEIRPQLPAGGWRFPDTAAFFDEGLAGGALDAWLFAGAIRRLAPPGWTLVDKGAPEAPPPPRPQPPARPSRAAALARRLIGPLRVAYVHGVRWAALPLSLWAALLPGRPPDLSRLKPPPAEPALDPAYLAWLRDELIPATLPLSLGEGFAARQAAAAQGGYQGGKLRVTTATVFSDQGNFEHANAVEAGERIVRTQHGGMYGTMSSVGQPEVLEFCADSFLTWGWREQEDIPGRFVPAPSPRLADYLGRYRRATDDLVMVGTRPRLRLNLVDTIPPASHWPEYRRQKLAFLDGLGELAGKVAYRPYTRALQEMADLDWLRRAHPALREVSGDLDAAMLGCRLLVLDHPGTTLAQALVADIPTVCYWDAAAWPAARQAEPYLAAMREVGIVCGSGAEAAAQVRRVWDDPEGWWRSAPVRQARAAFCRRYAWTSRFWLVHWLRLMATL